jgi:short-subunit dehydrogenase
VIFAEAGRDLVLVARTKERLESLGEELRGRFKVKVRVVPTDLTDPEAPARLFEELARAGIDIDFLVNNAGYGKAGPFAESDPDSQVGMVRLNVSALTHLTRLFIPPMLSRGRGRILNVASTAAFQPGPFMAVYYATKAYVLSFSEALAEELRGTGVTVTALCPGPTATEFQGRASLRRSRLANMGMATAVSVAEQGYRGMMKGRTIVVTGLRNRLLAQSVRFSPRLVVRRAVRWINSEMQ